MLVGQLIILDLESNSLITFHEFEYSKPFSSKNLLSFAETTTL